MQEKNNKYERNEEINRATDEQHAPSVRSQTDSTLVESVNMKQEIRTTNLETSQEDTEQQNRPNPLPPAVNWHFWPWCNYGCKFCFATFEDLPSSKKMSKEEALTIPKMLADAGVKKLTFVGGEPTLCPYLGELLEEAKRVDLTTCIVSNGTGLTESFLDEWGHHVDWVGLSIDASNDELHMKIGRGAKRDLTRSKSQHLEVSIEVWNRCVARGIKMKLNTVVCMQNKDDDMMALINTLRPDRWKVFQVLPVKGQNDANIEDMTITDEEYQSWVERHRRQNHLRIKMICEENDVMRGSYAMMDALGRFYSNTSGGHSYGPPVFEVGVDEAWAQNDFIKERFVAREGEYDWSNSRRLPMATESGSE
ncbi:MAG: viperin family antiviral radical SAM protein, partial [Candidatus Poseidoniaceae archaeon]